MDYDENDFQSQNFHLVGEDKFSANVRSFALPKFVLDEHLRFDSLVEEEDLLGIQGHGNNWIDFPTGNSAIEFSSSAVESCSIARHKNVWSEATSSESVDLLLKSVGEDEMINNKAVIMEISPNDESRGITNDDHESYMMNILPVDHKMTQDKIPEKFSGSNVGNGEVLLNLHGLPQSAGGEDSRIAMYIDRSNGKFSLDGERDDNVMSFYNATERLKDDGDGLCEPVLNKKDVCKMLRRTEAPSVSDSDSSALDNRSLKSNQDVRPVIENEKSSSAVFSSGQHERCIHSSVDFLSDNTHDDKTLMMYSDEASHQLVSKTNALEPLNRKSIYSVFPEKSDGLMADISYQTKYLNGNSEMCKKLFSEEECMNREAMAQEENVENNSVTNASYQSIGKRLPFDSIEDDDDFSGIRTKLIDNSAMPCDVKRGEFDTCMDAIDHQQDTVGKLVEKKNTDVEDDTQILTESPSSNRVCYEAQGTEIEDCGRMGTNLQSFTCENSGLDVEDNRDTDLDVDVQEVKLGEDKDHPDECSFPVNLTDESSLPVVIGSEPMTSLSTYCKANASPTPVSLTEVLTSEVQVHLSTPEHTTIDLAVGKKGASMQVLSKSDMIPDDRKALKVSCIAPSSFSTADMVSKEESGFASVSYPLNIKEASFEKILHFDSDPQLLQGTAGLNLAVEHKVPTSCLVITDSVFYKGNELKLSGASMLSNSKLKVDKETANSEVTGSYCIEDAIATEHLSTTVMQPPPPVRSIGFTQIDISSSEGNSVGDGKILQLEGSDICNDPRKGKDDFLDSLEVVSHVRDEASIVLDNLNSHTKYSSQICSGITTESNSSEAQSGNSNSSERNCHSPTVIHFGGCPPNNSDRQELKTSSNMAQVSSGKYEITRKVDGSNGLHETSVEDGSFIFGGSPSMDATARDNCSDPSLLNLKIQKDNSQGLPVEVKVFESSTETPIRGKPKNASRPSNEKKAVSKGKIKKEARALKQSTLMEANCSISAYKSVENISKDKPLVEMRDKTPIECSAMKTLPFLDAQASSIPDLNSSSSLALSHHHFTDLQQVQLRAQIFVYGALISGMPPDEAYMVSAFGGADGGRNLWHGVWHTSIERFHNHKSPLGCYDTPHSRPAIWIPEHVSMGNDVQSKVPTTCATKNGNVIISSSVLSATVSLPSPLWSLSYGSDGHHASISRGTYMNFSQTPSPLPRQSFVSRQHVGASPSWLSQSSRPVPWFFSSQVSSLDGIPQYSSTPATETALVAPVRDSCVPHTPTIEVSPNRVLMHVPDAAATTTAAVLQMETTKGAATCVNNKYTPTTQKVRKRKKSTTADDLNFPSSQSLAVSVSTPSNFKSVTLPAASTVLSSNSQLNVFNHSPLSISTPHIISPTHQQIFCANDNQHISTLYEETCSKLEQAKLQAEGAAALAASTVKYNQGIWNQLAAHKSSGIVLQIEEKLASAAVAAAAAASVAKAAAAAANVASAAALQAKFMADEAISATRTVNTVFNSETDILDVGKRLAGIPPVSILRGMDKIHGSGAIISAASEVARRRVESASAATKRAENLDAIVKAAELAAEAVTQAGTIIAMGDPLPFTLRELVDAGPEDFWRRQDGTAVKLSQPSNMHGEEHASLDSIQVHGESSKHLDDQYSNDKETQKATGEGELSSLNECHQQLQRSTQGNFSCVGPETDDVIVSSIQKGSVVEVMSDDDGLKGAWLSARVIEMDNNKAYVCYDDVSTTEGKLKEWIVLDNGEKSPKIRIARSITLVKQEGTRKRRRAHMGSYIWEVGDHVDAWIHDRWWEGTVTERSPADETKLTVHFPARGDKHVVNAWNLRPSLIWKDGQWLEWSLAKEKSSKPHEGDTPREKRQRVGRLEEQINSKVDVDGMVKLSNDILTEGSSKIDDSRTLLLPAKDRTFCIGKNSSEHVTFDALKQKRTGLQKDGSRVVFGVPRPGKKRKFMEVSKHYVANKSDKISEGNDSIKFAKYLMPQTSRQSRNASKVDGKGKKTAQIKPRGSVKAVNTQRFQIRRVDDKEKASLPTSNNETVHAYHKDVISSSKGSTNGLDKLNAFKFGSFQNQAEKKKVSAMESEHSMQPATATLSKKKSTTGSHTDLAVRQTTSTDRTPVIEDKGHGNHAKPIHEVLEPRRSNRRIQPTSRLLEGIQSSLVISKVPSISHERKLPRGGTSSKGSTHG